MKCPDCGVEVEQDAKFCPKCFARLEPPGFWRRLLALFQNPAKPRRPMISVKKTLTIKTTDKEGRTQEYHSLDEVPPEMRKEIEKLETNALKETFRCASSDRRSMTIISEKSVSAYRVEDQAANERVYHSLEEMPPEIRAAIEQTKDQRKTE